MNIKPSKTKNSDTFMMTLAADTEVHLSRSFDAPIEKLWKVLVDPARISDWWGPRGTVTKVDKMDLRVGGAWQYIVSDPDGRKRGVFRGEYKEIVPFKKLVYTFEYEPYTGHMLTETTTLEEQGGKTLMTVQVVYDNQNDRDSMIQAGMEMGNRESWDRLEELLASTEP
jgi:uncharacterized protein YndB with AHSA1/START domain